MDYRQKAISSFSWTAVLRGFFRLTTFVKTAILARILSPAQFGIFGITTISLSFLEIITETGINPFLIQEKEIDPYIDTAWFISIFRGILISLFVFLLAAPISAFFSSPQSKYLLQLTALIPLIRGFINPSCVRLVKSLQFNFEFYYRACIVLFEAILAVFLTLLIKSELALVIAMTAAAVWEVLASFIFISPRPKLRFNTQKARQIFSRGKWVTSFGILEFLFTNGDNIIVGRLLGNTSLGLYQNAYKLSTVPLGEINDIVYKTSFPLFSHMQSASHRDLKSSVLKITSISLLVMFCLGALLFTLTEPVVLLLLGPNWIEIVPTVKVLAFLGVIKGVSYSFNALFMSRKKQHYVTLITLVSVLGLASCIIPLVQRFGIIGAGLSAVVGSLVSLPLSAYFIARELKSK